MNAPSLSSRHPTVENSRNSIQGILTHQGCAGLFLAKPELFQYRKRFRVNRTHFEILCLIRKRGSNEKGYFDNQSDQLLQVTYHFITINLYTNARGEQVKAGTLLLQLAIYLAEWPGQIVLTSQVGEFFVSQPRGCLEPNGRELLGDRFVTQPSENRRTLKWHLAQDITYVNQILCVNPTPRRAKAIHCSVFISVCWKNFLLKFSLAMSTDR